MNYKKIARTTSTFAWFSATQTAQAAATKEAAIAGKEVGVSVSIPVDVALTYYGSKTSVETIQAASADKMEMMTVVNTNTSGSGDPVYAIRYAYRANNNDHTVVYQNTQLSTADAYRIYQIEVSIKTSWTDPATSVVYDQDALFALLNTTTFSVHVAKKDSASRAKFYDAVADDYKSKPTAPAAPGRYVDALKDYVVIKDSQTIGTSKTTTYKFYFGMYIEGEDGYDGTSTFVEDTADGDFVVSIQAA